MEIKSLEEFYSSENTQDISLYISYLEGVAHELESSLEAAKTLNLNDVKSEIEDELAFVRKLIKLINDSFAELIINSVNNMSDSTLADIIEDKKRVLKESAVKLEESLSMLEQKLAAEKEEFTKYNRENGYDSKFYDTTDAHLFFSCLLDAQEYLKYLISSNLDEAALLELLTSIDDSNYTLEDIKKTVDKILSFRKVLKFINKNNDIDSLIEESFFSENGEQLNSYLHNLQEEFKKHTQTFSNLSKNLQEKIQEEGFSGKTFAELKRIYIDYKKSGQISIPNTYANRTDLEELRNLKENLNLVKKAIDSLENMPSDRQSQIDYVLSLIQLPTRSLDSLENKLKKRAELKAEIDKIQSKIDEKKKTASLISTAMSPDYLERDLRRIRARNSLRLLNAFGKFAEAECIKDVFDLESKRLKRFEILGNAIKNLNSIKAEIMRVKESKNILRNLNGKNKQELAELLEQYKKIAEEAYHELKNQEVALINNSDVYFVSEESNLKLPRNFKEIFNPKNANYITMSESLYSEFKVYKAFPEEITYEEIEEQYKLLYILSNKLHTINELEDGIFAFYISEEEVTALIELQKMLLLIYKKGYEGREKYIKDLKDESYFPISSEAQEICKNFGITEGGYNSDSLNKFNEQVNSEINNFEIKLAELEKELNCENADYESYYQYLYGFNNTVLSDDTIRGRIFK